METETKIKQISEVLDTLAEDITVPKNIRKNSKDAKEMLLNEKEPLDIRSATATFILDEMANDPNLPLHARTLIWNIMSQLETLK